jgi:uncharacterized protein YegP (UPF0339 family)
MAGTFEIYKDRRGEYRFRLKSRNGEIVAQGESYPTKAHAKRGIASVQRAATDAKIKDLTTTDGGLGRASRKDEASATSPLGIGTRVWIDDRDHPAWENEGEVVEVDGDRRLVRLDGGSRPKMWFDLRYLGAAH